MKLHFYTTTFVLFFISSLVHAQYAYPTSVAAANPLLHPREILSNREIALIFDTKDDNNDYKIRQKFFDVNQLNLNDINTDIALDTGFAVYTGAPDNNGNRHIGSCAGYFNEDGKEDYLVATEGPDYDILLRAYNANVQGGSLLVNPAGSGINFGHLTMSDATAGFIRLASGNFNDENEHEAVLLYREDLSDVLQITIYDFDANLNLSAVGSIADESMTLVSSFESFDLQVVDLDYDGTDEIVIAGSQNVNSTRQPFVKVYDVVMSGSTATLIPREKTYVPTSLPTNSRMTIALTSGDFNGDFVFELALAYGTMITDNNGNTPDTWLRLFRVGDDTLNTPGGNDWLEKTILLPDYYESVESINELQALDLDAGDMNGDGNTEIVLGTRNEIQLFSIDDQFNIVSTNPFGGSYSNTTDVYSDQFITVGDMNNDGMAEVLNVRNWTDMDNQDQHMSITVFFWNQSTASWSVMANNNQLLPRNYSGASSARQFSVVIGDFDADNIRFGEAVYHEYTNVVQPIVILNATPTHSDAVGPDGWVDVNNLWGDSGDCSPFGASYSFTNGNSISITTTLKDAWSVSAEVGVGYEGLVGSVEASFGASYGESYSNSESAIQEIRTTSTTTTCFDDAIYASFVTYRVYEYPVYVGDDFVTNVISIHPHEWDFGWISTKSNEGQYFITEHEPGHLLSYRPFGSPQFDNGPSEVFFTTDPWTTSTTASYTFGVASNQIQETTAETERNLGLSASVSGGAFGFTASVSGSYDWSEVSTHTASVGTEINVETNFGELPLSSNNALYKIKPYFFWGQNGSLVLDYEIETTGDLYDDYYSIQDPAWNMPWRLDENRGYDFDFQTKTRQSKSIWFDKLFPQAGDTIEVGARVFNYSLIATESPVKVKFFYGNPYNGGVPVTGIDGEEFVITASPITRQQYQDVAMTIVLPDPFPYDGRIYARIDPDSVMTEVHEENNLCWRWLGPYFPISDDDFETTSIREEYQSSGSGIFRSFPNPASDFVQFTGILRTPSDVQITLYNLHGQVVKTHSNMDSPAFVNERLDVSDIAPGFYIAEITGGSYRERLEIVLH